MAITDVSRARTHASGSWQQGQGREYTSRYTVECSSSNDGPATIMAYFLLAGNVPRIGAPYIFGNDFDFTSFCDSITPTFRVGSADPYIWDVDCHFSAPGKRERGETEEGAPTDDPFTFHDEISTAFVKRPVPVETAEYIEGFTSVEGRTSADQWARERNTPTGPVTNSSGEVYDPPLEMDQPLEQITITKRLDRYPGDLIERYNGRVNRNDFTIDKPKYKFRRTFPKYTVRVDNIDTQFAVENGKPLWIVTFVLLVDYYLTWRPQILDRGIHARAEAGDPDGVGGIVSASEAVDGKPTMRRLTDVTESEQPLSEPIPLDGCGQPLAAGKPAIYVTWRVYEEADLSGLKL